MNDNLWPTEMLISRGKGALWGLAEICTITSNDNCHDGHDDENFDDDSVAAAVMMIKMIDDNDDEDKGDDDDNDEDIT